MLDTSLDFSMTFRFDSWPTQYWECGAATIESGVSYPQWAFVWGTRSSLAVSWFSKSFPYGTTSLFLGRFGTLAVSGSTVYQNGTQFGTIDRSAAVPIDANFFVGANAANTARNSPNQTMKVASLTFFKNGAIVASFIPVRKDGIGYLFDTVSWRLCTNNGVPGLGPDVGSVVIDSSLSSTSENPVQNKVINSALENKAPLASPALTGKPTAPTAAAGTNTTQIATTAFVQTAVVPALYNTRIRATQLPPEPPEPVFVLPNMLSPP